MGNRYASDKNAIANCDRCGFQYKLTKLRKITIKGVLTNTKVCPVCWEPDHPQLQLGEFPVDDPQAIRDPRPDYNELATSRALFLPVPGAYSFAQSGIVTVTTT